MNFINFRTFAALLWSAPFSNPGSAPGVTIWYVHKKVSFLRGWGSFTCPRTVQDSATMKSLLLLTTVVLLVQNQVLATSEGE